jgi:hypothetical protein
MLVERDDLDEREEMFSSHPPQWIGLRQKSFDSGFLP